MSDQSERRSMEDVLASIRRIIRAEKAPEPTPDPPVKLTPGPSEEAAAKSAPAPEPQPAAEAAPEPQGDAEPLALTPEMMVRAEPAENPLFEEVEPEPEPVEDAPAAALPAEVDADAEGKRSPMVMDEAVVEAMIRRVLHEELMGEIGQNISANVQRLIETEVTRRLPPPK